MLSISPIIPKKPPTYRGMGLAALSDRLAMLTAIWRDANARHDALLAEYDATLPAIPNVLLYTERDVFLFGDSVKIGAPVPECVYRFERILDRRDGSYRVVDGKLVFTEFEESKARAKEIVAARKAWNRAANDHAHAIGLTGIWDVIDELLEQRVDLGRRIARIRAQSLDGLRVKTLAASYLDDDSPSVQLISESIIRDLKSMTKSTTPPTAARALVALVA